MTGIGARPLFAYVLCSLIANAGVAVTGFGMALIFVFCFTLFEMIGALNSKDCGAEISTSISSSSLCDMKYAVFLQSLSLVGSMPFLLVKANAFGLYRRNRDPQVQSLLLTLVPVTLVSTPVGQWCQNYLDSAWIRLVVGIVVTLVVGYEILKHIARGQDRANHSNPTTQKDSTHDNPADTKVASTEKSPLLPDETNQHKEHQEQSDDLPNALQGFSQRSILLWGTVLGFASGFLGGLIGMRGPPLMVFFLHFPFAKEQARMVGAILLFLNMALRVSFYAASDYFDDYHYHHLTASQNPQPWFDWPHQSILYVGVILAGILGVPIGDWIHHRIPQQNFQFVLAFILAFSGIVNILKAMSELSSSSR